MRGTRQWCRVLRELHALFVLIERSNERSLEGWIREQHASITVDDHSGIPADQRREKLGSRPQRVPVLYVCEAFELVRGEGTLVHLLVDRRDRESGPVLDPVLEE